MNDVFSESKKRNWWLPLYGWLAIGSCMAWLVGPILMDIFSMAESPETAVSSDGYTLFEMIMLPVVACGLVGGAKLLSKSPSAFTYLWPLQVFLRLSTPYFFFQSLIAFAVLGGASGLMFSIDTNASAIILILTGLVFGATMIVGSRVLFDKRIKETL